MEKWNNQHPSSDEYAHYYSDYVSLVPKENIISILNDQMHEFYTLANAIRGDRAIMPYADGKWTLKQLIGHLIETERVFAFRALAFSRGDSQKLPEMNQDEWVNNSNHNSRSIADLCNEYLAVRTSTIHLFKSMSSEMILRTGVANHSTFSVRALAYIIAGHERHHIQNIQKYYFK